MEVVNDIEHYCHLSTVFRSIFMVPTMQVLDIRVCGHVIGDLNTGGSGLPNHLYDTASLLCPLLPGM